MATDPSDRKLKEVSKALSFEEWKIILKNAPRELLVAEIDRRGRKSEALKSGLQTILRDYLRDDEVEDKHTEALALIEKCKGVTLQTDCSREDG